MVKFSTIVLGSFLAMAALSKVGNQASGTSSDQLLIAPNSINRTLNPQNNPKQKNGNDIGKQTGNDQQGRFINVDNGKSNDKNLQKTDKIDVNALAGRIFIDNSKQGYGTNIGSLVINNNGKDNKINDNKGYIPLADNKGSFIPDNRPMDNRDNRIVDNRPLDNRIPIDNRIPDNRIPINNGGVNTRPIDNKIPDNNRPMDNRPIDNRVPFDNSNRVIDNKGFIPNDNKGYDNKGYDNKGYDNKGYIPIDNNHGYIPPTPIYIPPIPIINNNDRHDDHNDNHNNNFIPPIIDNHNYIPLAPINYLPDLHPNGFIPPINIIPNYNHDDDRHDNYANGFVPPIAPTIIYNNNDHLYDDHRDDHRDDHNNFVPINSYEPAKPSFIPVPPAYINPPVYINSYIPPPSFIPLPQPNNDHHDDQHDDKNCDKNDHNDHNDHNNNDDHDNHNSNYANTYVPSNIPASINTYQIQHQHDANCKDDHNNNNNGHDDHDDNKGSYANTYVPSNIPSSINTYDITHQHDANCKDQPQLRKDQHH